mgnify:CR=1 FL=1
MLSGPPQFLIEAKEGEALPQELREVLTLIQRERERDANKTRAEKRQDIPS